MGIKGYKAFNKDLKCRGFQYEIGKEFEHKRKIELCEEGFHFCKKIVDIQGYYNLKNEETRLCEVEATGKVIEGDDKCVTDKIKIIKEISKEEMYILGNEGKGNSELVRKSSDYIISIPMKGKINSLNASVAAGILIYEIDKSRRR